MDKKLINNKIYDDEEDVQEIPNPTKKVKISVELLDNTKIIPWVSQKTLNLHSPLLRMHNEIIEFFLYISPSDEEHRRREEALSRVQIFLKDCLPKGQIEAFGSFRTKLYLPNADIDIVCMDDSISEKTLYSRVAKQLIEQNTHFEQVNLITNAKVPIIKFVEVESQLNFDLSFNKYDGIRQLGEVSKSFAVYPQAKYLILMLKCMLKQRDLNETYSGGIGSFLLFCIVIAFMREFKKEQIKAQPNQEVLLSEYMLKFLDFFGQKFEVQKKRIIMIDGGRIVDKPNQDDRFSLISPQDPDHDVGHSAYKIKEIFSIFRNRYNFLTHYNFQQNESVLVYLLNPSKREFTFLKQ